MVTFFIACLIIYSAGYPPELYVVAWVFWMIHFAFHSDKESRCKYRREQSDDGANHFYKFW